MTTSPELDALSALANHLAAPRPVEMRAGSAIVMWLRDQAAAIKPPTVFGTVADLLGLRVVPDDRLDTGEWKVFDQRGTEYGAGRVGQPGDQIEYWPGVGFVTINLPAGTFGAMP